MGTMNRILKIFALILLVPFYWGIGLGCTGGLTGGGGLPGGFNGATPGGGDGTPGGGDYRPSGQPTGGIQGGPPPGKFYMSLNMRSVDQNLFTQLCSPFVAKMWQDPKKYGPLYAAIKQQGPTTDGGGTVEPPSCRVNGIKESDEECDDESGCCELCRYKDINRECQNRTIQSGGHCTKDHACVVPPTIHVSVKTTHPDKDYSFDINLCPLNEPKMKKIDYDVTFEPLFPLESRKCVTNVEVSAELKASNGEVYKSPVLNGICPMPDQNDAFQCQVNMTLSKDPQAPGPITCYYRPTKDLMDIDMGDAVMEKSP